MTGPAFDPARAMLRRADVFPRFRTDAADEIAVDRLPAATPLLIFARGEQRRGLLRRQMVYHHVAQGELAGEPYVVTF
ncbi:MAG: hypothetical protein ACE5IK_10030 [Acidobacteriota bacterium]